MFVRPSQASQELLPEGFPVDKNYEWLEVVHFGEEVQQRSEERRKKQAVAKELGFADESSLADGQWFASLDIEERRRFKEEVERKQRFELPDHTPRNPDQRSDRVREQAAGAPGRTTERRMRSVSVDREAVKQKAKEYLRHQYTNADGEMICQVCQTPLPFKLDDGSYYFEVVEFLPSLENRRYQNYLALCPNHGAMFLYAHGSREIMEEMFVELVGTKLEVILAQKDAVIYFTETHLVDLRAVLESEALAPSEDEGG